MNVGKLLKAHGEQRTEADLVESQVPGYDILIPVAQLVECRTDIFPRFLPQERRLRQVGFQQTHHILAGQGVVKLRCFFLILLVVPKKSIQHPYLVQ